MNGTHSYIDTDILSYIGNYNIKSLFDIIVIQYGALEISCVTISPPGYEANIYQHSEIHHWPLK